MIYVDLELYVYHDTALAEAVDRLPGLQLLPVVRSAFLHKQSAADAFTARIIQSTRKLCIMWEAGSRALSAEDEFWSSALQEAPALTGGNAVNVHYHLEAFVLFARASLDVAANMFGWLLPKPFPQQRYDSINAVLKNVQKFGPAELKAYIEPLRQAEDSWLSILAGTSRGRSLRDKLAHQIEFPIDYVELRPRSEKRYAIVYLDGGVEIPLAEFIESVRRGVVEGYLKLEDACISALAAA